jgi:AcrR family transcriptional regulator
MRERLLRATLEVLTERSLEAITLREITAAAGANIAAVNYYFGSREQLLAEALSEAFRPINRARLEALDACEKCAAPRAPDVTSLVEALILPMLRHSRDDAGGRTAIRLLLQLRSVPSSRYDDVLAAEFDTVHRRFLTAFQHALPEASPEEIRFGYDFARGAALHILSEMDNHVRSRTGWDKPQDGEVVLCHLIRFVTQGLQPTAKRAVRKVTAKR